ncbi:hypothetical protein TVNIR_0187 [Thioalkalivibrio nitratireducens DSM 14787]|uniref:Uncharacterized protein n=1 Tax=Thioalkalivibrio nitratireducens (strain DSM 14787 / UNIQEM 213 / ALEN2) TaxID=1255043 RepID=L0DSD0_THIND|nr:hypothetical protein [Thioalkalivibrio nitratireducens]AGA31898.1 hypothetical protein TVNIR_0187 [Thioalkalivibrio nitratireducens DSM 14787]
MRHEELMGWLRALVQGFSDILWISSITRRIVDVVPGADLPRSGPMTLRPQDLVQPDTANEL